MGRSRFMWGLYPGGRYRPGTVVGCSGIERRVRGYLSTREKESALRRVCLQRCDINLLELAAHCCQIACDGCAQEELRDLIELLGGVNIGKSIGVHYFTYLVAVRQCQLNVCRVEAIGNQRVRVSFLDGVQCVEVGRVVLVIIGYQRKIAAFNEDVLGLRAGNGFQINGVGAFCAVNIGNVFDVACGKRRESCFRSLESVASAE